MADREEYCIIVINRGISQVTHCLSINIEETDPLMEQPTPILPPISVFTTQQHILP